MTNEEKKESPIEPDENKSEELKEPPLKETMEEIAERKRIEGEEKNKHRKGKEYTGQ